MNPDSERIKEVFLKALQHEGRDERHAFLVTACQDSPELMQEVESLLRASERAGDFLSQAKALAPSGFELEPPGTMIGRYQLCEKIGEGGFGVVYLAQQLEPMQRHVAVKIIKPGMDTREVIARFEAERAVLALMDHANIARVLDGGDHQHRSPILCNGMGTWNSHHGVL